MATVTEPPVIGDSDFRRIFEQHVDAVYRYCLRRASRAEAADAVSEVFLTLWRRRSSLDLGAELPWLYGTARKVLANQRRSLARRMRLIDKARRQPPTGPAEDDSPAGELVLSALNDLAERDREVIRLSIWEDLSLTEIGVVLGCSPGAASMRLHRALDRLAHRVAAQEAIR